MEKTNNIIVADNQAITHAGILYILSDMGFASTISVRTKKELMLQLKQKPYSIVILDYTLFDFDSESDLQNIVQRYPKTYFILWSEDLSVNFIRTLMNNDNRISILLKDAKLSEIKQCIEYNLQGNRYLCQHATNILLAPISTPEKESVKLTKTEIEVLKDIALGMTTREIAEKRISSFHTVNTHRKNIFRKIGVNNVHEATRYAMRTGLVDAAEYYI
nr:response regulator transcription factor [uncultured Prevotella sp.]